MTSSQSSSTQRRQKRRTVSRCTMQLEFLRDGSSLVPCKGREEDGRTGGEMPQNVHFRQALSKLLAK